ncbi:MAG: protein kinase, partial [Oscillospiraceae bacterium]|nr:protein kinase [Oscillospiraceae bacterium]
YYPNGAAFREKNGSYKVYTGASDQEEFQKGRNRFLAEARTLAKFQGFPGIVEVRDFFEENDTAYIVMEYLSGITLKSYLKKKGRLSVEETLSMMQPLIVALQEVHKKGVIHRDISPDNIMLLWDGRRKLLDFGGAREMSPEGGRSLSILLKPGYAPEEQYRSRGKQGSWTDVYGLCATIYRCITGEVPLEALERCQEDHLEKPHDLGVKISRQEEAALMRGMAVYAEERFQTMEELERALYYGEWTDRQETEQTRPLTHKAKTGKIFDYISAILFVTAIICFLGALVFWYNQKSMPAIQNTGNTEENFQNGTEHVIVTNPQYVLEEKKEMESMPKSGSVYQVIGGTYTWQEARQYCERQGGHLAAITSEEEQKKVEQLLRDYENENETPLYAVWLGGSRAENGEFQWSTGEFFETYEKWADGEPNNEGGVEQYLIMYNVDPQNARWFWNDAPGDVTEYYTGYLGFVMEKE